MENHKSSSRFVVFIPRFLLKNYLAVSSEFYNFDRSQTSAQTPNLFFFILSVEKAEVKCVNFLMNEYEKTFFYFNFLLTATQNFFIFIPWAAWDAALSAGIIPHLAHEMINSITSIFSHYNMEANAFFYHLRMWVVEIFLPPITYNTHITVACEKWLRKILQQWFNLYVKASSYDRAKEEKQYFLT